MRNVRALVSYDGSKFFGWQRQDGFGSVQEALEDAVQSLCGERAAVHGAGRTDTGVHAFGQVCNLHIDTDLTDDRLRHALNAHVEQGVVIQRLETCREDFHARFDALGKRYLYLTQASRFRSPLGRQYSHWVSDPLDLEAMRAAGLRLIGKHDFRAFGNAGSPRKTTVRTVRHLRWIARRGRVAFVIEGDGFLYNMVRTIAGTLIDVGRGRLDPDVVSVALDGGERELLGPTAPAGGLYLVRVLYGEETFRGPDRGPRGVPGAFQPGGARAEP